MDTGPGLIGARRWAGAVVALLAILLGALLVTSLVAASGPAGRSGARPALPADAALAPLARPQAAPAGSGGYRLLERQDDGSGRPVRWDPCRPIHYVVRPQGAPPGGAQAVRQAAALVQQLTGLQLHFDGVTDEVPRANRARVDAARYGSRWSPVLVAWTDPREYPAMAGYAGLGGPDSVEGAARGQRRYVTGVVLLNRDYLSVLARAPGGQRQLSAVVLHEFGHLIGLDHVDDPGQLMYRQPSWHPGGFAPGDRRGLAVLSAGPCFRDF